MIPHRPPRFDAAGSARVLVALGALALAALPLGRAAVAAAHGTMTPPERAAAPGADTFASTMEDAMRRMDAGMRGAPTGDADRDFARMMIPHHQGAVDMALAELRFGKDERLRRLAQGIIVEQRQEIALMQSILDGQPPSSAATR